MLDPQPAERPEVLSSAGVQSQLWRRVLAIASQYEDSWQHDQSIDPIVFAKLHPDIPQNILSLELTRLRDELVAATNDSVTFEENARRFTIIDTLRTGGMGVVYLAYDHACNREVALKKIRPEFRDDPHVIRRFHAEAELTAALEHPGIIPIYARGADSQGEDFYAMRLVGRSGASTLAKAIHEFHEDLSRATEPGQKPRTQRLDRFRQMIRTLMTVADTIAYTHSCGIVHRDIKPSNILLGPYGEALIADGSSGIFVAKCFMVLG
jgi:serine/threonine protein kinase